MNIKYFRQGKQFTMIDPDFESPSETWRQLKMKFSDLEQIVIDGQVYKGEVNGLEQVELLKKLAKVK